MHLFTKMFSCANHRIELAARVNSISALLDATHQSPPQVVGAVPVGTPVAMPSQVLLNQPDVSREARGLAILLLYASYERLLVSLCRTVLEAAASLRVGNRRFKPGLKLFAVHPYLQAIVDSQQAAIWNGSGLDIVKVLDNTRECTIVPDIFPTDGTHMRKTQVYTFCNLLELGDPGPILREVWDRLDTVVIERNMIAHGAATADEIGRLYTIGEIRSFVALWQQRWGEFLNWVETEGSTRDFFRR